MKGGARVGAGRKTIAAELLRHDIQVDGVEDARYAYSLFVTVMQGGYIALERLRAAREVMNRVLGKPQQRIAGSWEGGEIPVQFVSYRDGLTHAEDNPAKAEG